MATGELMALSILMFVLVAVVAAIGVASVSWGRRDRARRAEIWRGLAERRDATFHPPMAWPQSTRAHVVAIVEHAVVLLDTHVVRSGSTKTTYTRARARFSAGAGPRFRVHREGSFALVGKLLGEQDVVLGDDPGFDERFVVKCDDEAATRLAWTHRARRLMYGLANASVESDGALVTIWLESGEDPSQLDAMLDLAGELGSYGARELAAFAELPDARWLSTALPWGRPRPPRVEVQTPRGAITIRCLPGHGRPGLQLTIASERDLSPFSVDIAGDRLGDGAPRGLLPDSAAQLLASLGTSGATATLSGDERRLRVAFATMPAPEVVAIAAKLLTEIAGGQQSAGAFR